jgi:hypothetical protein
MALLIMYFDGADHETRQVYGYCISQAAATLSGTSASAGTPPANAKLARIKAGEACYVSNNGAAASSTNGVTLAADEVIDMAVPIDGTGFLARTV